MIQSAQLVSVDGKHNHKEEAWMTRRRLARLEGHDTKRSGNIGGPEDHTSNGLSGRRVGEKTGLTCTRVRMTSMGLVRMEAVAAARGPEMA